MPTNRTRRTRSMKGRLTPAELAYLTDTDAKVEGLDEWCLFCFRLGLSAGDIHPRDLWEEYRDDFLPDYISRNPGKRCLPWWQWDAPRHDTGTGAYYEPLLIPRERMGGKGETMWEKYPAYQPSYFKGLPASWAWIDSEDPPTFDSEAAHLDRHNLLSETEKRYLTKHAGLLTPEKVVL